MSDNPSFDAGVIRGEALIGSCGVGENSLTDEQAQDKDFCAGVDSVAFCCDQCGWWYEIGEQSEDDGDQICEDCHRD